MDWRINLVFPQLHNERIIAVRRSQTSNRVNPLVKKKNFIWLAQKNTLELTTRDMPYKRMEALKIFGTLTMVTSSVTRCSVAIILARI